MNTFKQLSKGIVHLFFPNLCDGCRSPLLNSEEVICLNCETHLSRTNFHHIHSNETALRLSGRIPFEHATSLAYFTSDGLLQHLIHGLKYADKKKNGIFLGKEIGNAIHKLNWDIDTIVPVPLHKRKQAKRGYNQSEIIANGISEILKIQVISNALIRTRNTETQTDKTREQRIENVKDAFELKRPELVKGKHLLIVDDVLTTGATLESCALALLTINGVKVSIASAGLAID